MVWYSPKLLFALIPFGSSIPFLLNSNTNKLNATEPDWNRLIEVWFYGKDEKTTRIKVWIENLEDTTKSQYLEGNDWKNIGDSKKYLYLASLARDYLLTQHKINVFTSSHWLAKENKEIPKIKCTQCSQEECKTESNLGCFLKCSKEQKECNNNESAIIEDQKAFANHLTNLYSPWNDTYFQPVQAHIYLEDFDLSNNNENIDKKPTKLVGTTVYGFVDYSYKEKESLDFSHYESLFQNNPANLENKKYFINYPMSFSMDENNNNLKKIYEELEKTKDYKKEEHENETGECDNFHCLINKNYFKSLTTLDQSFKDIGNCEKK